ncbi:50S ribosomal protein L25/general stress protein Ctc [Actinotalea sp.]|uniref:50S ribosomal protein L25/general stress protein Ctc n=1 Tax=Actinotalea sp. TaxID=1872145 RepID=UPI003565859B
MSEVKLTAATRTEFGKGAARRIRRAAQIPAVLYGHGAEPQHVTLPGHETTRALRHSNVLLGIELDGKVQLAIAKDIQRDPIKDVIEHVDLLVVRKGEKVSVEVNVHVVGESYPGTIHVVETQSILLEAEATALPEYVQVSVEGLTDGTQVRVSDLELPAGATFGGDPETVIVTISTPQASAEDEAAVEEQAAAQSAASAVAAESEED